MTASTVEGGKSAHTAEELMHSVSPDGVIEISFARDRNGEEFTMSGWGEPEAMWTWTVGGESRLRLPEPTIRAGWKCAIQLIPFTHPPGLFAQHLILSVGGTDVFSGRIAEARVIDFEIVADLIAGPGPVELLIQCPDCIPPVALGLGTDPRDLGFALISLSLVPRAAAPDVRPDTPPPVQEERFGGFAELSYTEAVDIGSFGGGKGHKRMRVFASVGGPDQIPLHHERDFAPDFVGEHYRYPRPPEVCVYELNDCTLWGNGLLTHQGRFVLQDDCMPSYFRGYVGVESHAFPADWIGPVSETLVVHGACGVALHPNVVYGHFLLEMLPRLYLLGVLRDFGMACPIAVSDRTPEWLRDFVSLYFADSEIVQYDMSTQNIRAGSFIMPSMMHTDHNMHPAFNLMITDVLRRAGVVEPAMRAGACDASRQNRIYLSRRELTGSWHRLLNEEQVEEVMTSLGFAIVHPQSMSIRQQMQMFSTADVIASEYSSALHNAMFSRPGITVIALNCINWYQSVIGRLRRHRMAFVAPADGRFRDWRTRGSGDSDFLIDVATLRATVSDVIATSSQVEVG